MLYFVHSTVRKPSGSQYLHTSWALDSMGTCTRELGGLRSLNSYEAKSVVHAKCNCFISLFQQVFGVSQSWKTSSEGLGPRNVIRIANDAVPGFKLTNQTPRISHRCGWQLLEAQIYSTNGYQHWRAAEYFALGTARHSWRGVNAIIRNWNQRAPIPYKSKGAKVVKFILCFLLQKDQTASKIYPKQKICPNLDSAHIDTPVRCHPRCQHPWYYQGTKPIPISMSRNLWSVWMKCQRQNSQSHEVATLLYLRQKSDSPSPMADLHEVFFPGHQAPSTSTCGLGEDHCWWTSPFVYGTILEARKLWDSHIPRAVAEIQIPNPFGDVKSASGHHVSKSKSLVMSKARENQWQRRDNVKACWDLLCLTNLFLEISGICIMPQCPSCLRESCLQFFTVGNSW